MITTEKGGERRETNWQRRRREREEEGRGIDGR
jgi:hypothetical protein